MREPLLPDDEYIDTNLSLLREMVLNRTYDPDEAGHPAWAAIVRLARPVERPIRIHPDQYTQRQVVPRCLRILTRTIPSTPSAASSSVPSSPSCSSAAPSSSLSASLPVSLPSRSRP